MIHIQPEDKLQFDKIKKCLTSDDGQALVNHLQEKFQQISNQLRTATDIIYIHRYQGQLEVLLHILKLKED